MSSLWIINKAGGLIFQCDHFVSASNEPLSSNEALILAGTLHGIHAITAKINPTALPNAGIESLHGEGFTLTVLMTLTGTKLVLLSPPTHPNPNAALARAYEAYADQVMKNPFYTPEMPIRMQAFDEAVTQLVRSSSS